MIFLKTVKNIGLNLSDDAYSRGLTEMLEEWDSLEDEQAYVDLQKLSKRKMVLENELPVVA